MCSWRRGARHKPEAWSKPISLGSRALRLNREPRREFGRREGGNRAERDSFAEGRPGGREQKLSGTQENRKGRIRELNREEQVSGCEPPGVPASPRSQVELGNEGIEREL